MAKDSKRDSSSDDEHELDGIADAADNADGADDDDVVVIEEDESDVVDDAVDPQDEDADPDDEDVDLEDDDADLDDDDLDDDADLDDDEAIAAGATAKGTKKKSDAKSARGGATKGTKTRRAPAKGDDRKKSSIPGAAPGSFLQQVGSELSKVVWPTRKQMITYTSVVLVFVVMLVVAVWGFDLGVGKLMDWIFA